MHSVRCIPVNAKRGNEDHPVPEEDVDGLVVEVDGQYALHGVRMNVDHVLTANLEVAEGHSWKHHITLLGPVPVCQQVAHHFEAEGLILGGKDAIQQEQLSNHVADVEHLGDEEQHHQIVADSVAINISTIILHFALRTLRTLDTSAVDKCPVDV